MDYNICNLTPSARFLDLEKGDIRVAAYWTKLLPRADLAKKLHQAVRHARLSLAQTKA